MCEQIVVRKLCVLCNYPYATFNNSFLPCPRRLRGEFCGPVKITYDDIQAGTVAGNGGMCGDCVIGLGKFTRLHRM